MIKSLHADTHSKIFFRRLSVRQQGVPVNCLDFSSPQARAYVEMAHPALEQDRDGLVLTFRKSAGSRVSR